VGVCVLLGQSLALSSLASAVLSPSLTVAPAWWLSLGSSPALVLALGWCSLRIAAVIGGGVAVVGCAVVIGVLSGVASKHPECS
jgi:hypothetical protein